MLNIYTKTKIYYSINIIYNVQVTIVINRKNNSQEGLLHADISKRNYNLTFYVNFTSPQCFFKRPTDIW